jgi:ornithine cyclodeaminase/alanine dehydrogenase-like protein (mu-crystallin family)
MTHSPSQLLILGGEQVRRALPMDVCIEVIDRAMRTVSRGEARVPLRTVMPLPDSPNLFAVMPGYLGEPRSLGAKILALYPQNPQAGRSSHIGVVVYFDPGTGLPRAVMDAAEITAIRTAAASAVATRALARADARVLAILGTGEQAVSHLQALSQVRSLSAIRIWGRTPGKAQALAGQHAHLSVPIEVCETVQAAVQGADIICTLTASPEPILEGAWIAPGTHVNLVGASRRNAREADDEVVTRARFFVDLKASALAEAGEWFHAKEAGLVDEAHILAEIGEVLEGRVAGRLSGTDITVYKSVGFAAQDLACAQVIYERAVPLKIGTPVPF